MKRKLLNSSNRLSMILRHSIKMNSNITVLHLFANRSIPHLFPFYAGVCDDNKKNNYDKPTKVDSDSDAISTLDDDWGVDASHII